MTMHDINESLARDLREFTAALIRQGAGGIAAWIVGAAIVSFIAWKIGRRFRENRLRQSANALEVMYIVEAKKKRRATTNGAVQTNVKLPL